MAKQYIHKNNETYLRDDLLECKMVYYPLAYNYVSWLSYQETKEGGPNKNVGSAAQTVKRLFEEIEPPRYYSKSVVDNFTKNMPSHEDMEFIHKDSGATLTPTQFLEKVNELKNSGQVEISNFQPVEFMSHILLPVVSSAKFLAPNERGPKANHKMKQMIESSIGALQTIVDYAKEIVSVPELMSLNYRTHYYNQNTLNDAREFAKQYEIVVKKEFLLTHLKEFKKEMEKMFERVSASAPDFDPKDYKLKYFEPKALNDIEDIKGKQAYYLFSNYADGGFLTLLRTNHGRVMYEWGIGKNIEAAFLFKAPIENYAGEISSAFLKSASQVFVDMNFKNIVSPVPHPTIDAIKALIDKKDITELLDAPAKVSPVPAESAEPPLKKKNKI